MGFVLDASVAACWAFKDEDHLVARAAAERIRGDEAVAPGMWWFEIRNILIVNERRGRLTDVETVLVLRAMTSLGIVLDHAPDSDAVLALARRHRLTVYDAAYLELAQRANLPLATLDRALANAARIERVALIGAEAAPH